MKNSRAPIAQRHVDLLLQCALPADTLEEVVDLVLGLLGCGYDPARKNATLFFGGALGFRAVLGAFDKAGGLARLLACLQTGLMLLHGQQDLKAEKQVTVSFLIITIDLWHPGNTG